MMIFKSTPVMMTNLRAQSEFLRTVCDHMIAIVALLNNLRSDGR